MQRFFIQDLCDEMCGKNAICSIAGDAVECNCPIEMDGDPFVECKPKDFITDNDSKDASGL